MTALTAEELATVRVAREEPFAAASMREQATDLVAIIDRLVALLQAPAAAEVEAIRERDRQDHADSWRDLAAMKGIPSITKIIDDCHTLLAAVDALTRERDEAQLEFVDVKLELAAWRRLEPEITALRALKARVEEAYESLLNDDPIVIPLEYAGSLRVKIGETKPVEL